MIYQDKKLTNIYTPDEFLYEIPLLLMWKRIANNRWYTIEEYWSEFQVNNFVLPNSSLFTYIFRPYLEKKKIKYEISSSLPYYQVSYQIKSGDGTKDVKTNFSNTIAAVDREV